MRRPKLRKCSPPDDPSQPSLGRRRPSTPRPSSNSCRRHDRSDWHAQAEAVRDWHIENTQPDNATNRPWALHVFLLAGSPEGRHYAETLLHNALVTGPEPFCAWILMDVATWLEGEVS